MKKIFFSLSAAIFALIMSATAFAEEELGLTVTSAPTGDMILKIVPIVLIVVVVAVIAVVLLAKFGKPKGGDED